MNAWLTSGHIFDLILGMMVLEAILLGVYCHSRQRGLAALGLLANLVAGASLLLAMRLTLTQAGGELIGLCLALALVAHLLDLVSRQGLCKGHAK